MPRTRCHDTPRDPNEAGRGIRNEVSEHLGSGAAAPPRQVQAAAPGRVSPTVTSGTRRQNEVFRTRCPKEVSGTRPGRPGTTRKAGTMPKTCHDTPRDPNEAGRGIRNEGSGTSPEHLHTPRCPNEVSRTRSLAPGARHPPAHSTCPEPRRAFGRTGVPAPVLSRPPRPPPLSLRSRPRAEHVREQEPEDDSGRGEDHSEPGFDAGRHVAVHEVEEAPVADTPGAQAPGRRGWWRARPAGRAGGSSDVRRGRSPPRPRRPRARTRGSGRRRG